MERKKTFKFYRKKCQLKEKSVILKSQILDILNIKLKLNFIKLHEEFARKKFCFEVTNLKIKSQKCLIKIIKAQETPSEFPI